MKYSHVKDHSEDDRMVCIHNKNPKRNLLKSTNDPLLFNKKKDALQSLSKLEQMHLLKKLIIQLNKDLSLSGIDTQFNINWNPELLISHLTKIIAVLMEKDYQKFMNFLYRIDVSEKKLGGVSTSDFNEAVNEISLMILKKEWQKVWFRNRNLLRE